MMALMNGLSDQFVPRLYVLANTDQRSESKIEKFEQNVSKEKKVSVLFLLQKISAQKSAQESMKITSFSLYMTEISFTSS